MRAGDEARTIRVRDTGVGIAPEMLATVFDLFVQGGLPQGQRAQGGLGIGLTLVKRLVELHGGNVEAYSEGRGPRQRVHRASFPWPDAGSRASAVATTAAAPGGAPARVLVVDDNRDAADSLAMLLGMLGADARVENNGPDALAAMPVYRPSLVLLDIGMPGMSGHEVGRLIRERREFDDVRLVALTGWGQAEDRRRSRVAGFDQHLTKPVALADLEALLSTLETPIENRVPTPG